MSMVDWIVGGLALVVGLMMLASQISIALGREVSDERAAILEKLLSAIIAVVALYVGTEVGRPCG